MRKNYDVTLASNDERKLRHPSTQKFGRLSIFCHSESSLPQASFHSAIRP